MEPLSSEGEVLSGLDERNRSDINWCTNRTEGKAGTGQEEV